MAFKHSGPSAVPKITKTSTSPALQIPQQKLKSSLSTPTSFITAKDLQDALAESTQKMMLKIRQNNEEIIEKLAEVCGCLAGFIDRLEEKVEKLETKIESMDKRFEQIEEKVESLQNDIIMTQFREMEFALRIRGLPEDGQEDLKVKVATSLAPVLGCDYGKNFEEIESAYRINSRIAKQRNLPRDVVIYFSRKARRNEIIWTYYQQKFQIANQDIILLKEIPFKILQKRKDFAFLTQELKNRQIPFRWNIPIGIMVTFDNKRYRLDTLQKAKEFYLSILKAEKSPPLRSEGVGGLSKLFEEVLSFQGDVQILQLSEAREDVDQMMTRAAYRRKAARDKEKKGT